MKKLLASLALLFYVNILCSQIVIYSAESVGGTDNQWGKKIALDNSGASVILIEYSGSVSLDSTVYLEGIVNSTAIAKYSGANLNWSANIIAEELNDICTDDQNNIYLVGYGSTNGVTFIGPADTITILNSYQGINWDGPYLIKLDSSGHFIYGRYFNHGSGAFTNVSKATSVNSDHSGNVYVAGELQFFFFYDMEIRFGLMDHLISFLFHNLILVPALSIGPALLLILEREPEEVILKTYVFLKTSIFS